MARSFTAASSMACRVNVAPVTAAAFTMAAWVYPTSLAATRGVLWLGDKDVTNQYFYLQLNTVGRVVFDSRNGATFGTAQTASGLVTVNNWSHVACVETSSTSRAVYHNGTGKATNTTSVTPSGADRFSIGALDASTPANYMEGLIAVAALWSLALTDDEIFSLACGKSPWKVQAANLVGYWPLYGLAATEADNGTGANDLTLVNAPTLADHPELTVRNCGGRAHVDYIGGGVT